MNALRYTSALFLSLIILLAGCTPLKYQSVNLDADDTPVRTDGYIDRKVSEGVHVIEVRHENIAALMIQKESTLNNLKGIWERRASELCPKGYQGQPEVIQPDQARTDAFYCTLRACQKYLLVSGIVYCNTVYKF